MILELFIFIRIGVNSYQIADLIQYNQTMSLTGAFQSIEIATKYCPLNIKYYQYQQLNDENKYFLGSLQNQTTGELFYIYYLELLFNKKKIIHHVLIKQDNAWIDVQGEQDNKFYEGRWVNCLTYYDDEQMKLIVAFIRNEGVQQFQFKYQKINLGKAIFLNGGAYKGLNPLNNQELILNIFPGKFQNFNNKGKYQVLQSLIFNLFDSLCNDVFQIVKEDILQIPSSKLYKQFTQNTENLFYYKLTFWALIDESLFDLDFDQEINIVRISANKFSINFQGSGSNSFILQYIYSQLNQEWKIQIEYYTFDIPLVVKYEDNNDPFRKNDEILIQNKICVFSWQQIIIEYDQDVLNFQLNNLMDFCQIKRSYSEVNQFSGVFYRFYFGGSTIDQNTLGMSISIISFYNCKKSNQICHYSCKTCFGPSKNSCLSCFEDSNRIFSEKYSSCPCKIWYTEYNQKNCLYFPKEYTEKQFSFNLQHIEDNIQEDQNHQCKFGEFLHQEQCFQCPSASQINSISCSECLKNSLNWIVEGARCGEIYYKNQRISQNYLQSSNNEINNQFIFQYNEIIPCNGCVICQKGQNDCYLSNLQHLNQETYIKCQESYIFKNEECIIDISQIKLIKQCPQNCLKCKDDQCLICNTNYFLTYNGQCQLCQISRCQYCFQYNLYNLKQNSIFQEEQMDEEFSDNYVTGCLLCDKYFYYSFEQGRCLKQNQNVGCQYYENEKGIKICYSAVLNNISNKLQQIEDCQNYLPNCKICVHYDDNLLTCTKCDQGFYIQISNGSCKSCNYDNTQHIQECSVDSINQDNYKLNFIGNYQTLTQNYFNIKGFLQQLNVFKIKRCQQYYQTDLKQNICNSNCQYCEDCQLINYKYQCLLCSGQDDSGSVSYSQINGICYKCPTSCSMCYPSTSQQLAYYNPYYIFDPLNPPLRCIKNIDEQQTYIDFESGQIYPIDQSNQKKSYFSINANQLVQVNSEIIKQSPKLNFQLQYFTQDYQQDLFQKLFSLKQVNFSFRRITIDLNKTLINISSFFCNDCISIGLHQITIYSNYGLKVQIENITQKNQPQINLQTFSLNFVTYLEVQYIFISGSLIQSSKFLKLNSFYQKGFTLLKEISFKDSIFNNSMFLEIRSDYSNEFIIEGLIFKNCIFNNYSFIQYTSSQNQNVQINNLEIINCTFYNTTFISFSNTNLILKNIKINESLFYDSYFSYSTGQLSLEKLETEVIFLSNSILCLNYFQDSFFINEITLNNIEIYSSSIFTIIPKEINETVVVNINQIQINSIIIINSFLIQAQQVSAIIDGIQIFSQQIFPILQFLNCDKIIINNLQQIGIEKEENQEINQNSTPIFQIKNFNHLQISNILIRNQSQSNNKIFYISSDSQTDVNLIIQNLSVESVFSQISSQSQNQLIQIMIQSKSSILFQNCVFNSIVFKYNTPTTDSQLSSLMFISSPNSQVNLQNLTYQNISVVNSSQSLIKVDANPITLRNLFISQIQTASNYTVNSACGFGYFYAQDFQMIDSVIQNVVSVTYGLIFTQMKLNGNFLVQNCFFDNSVINSESRYIPLYGGVFTIDASFSELNFIVQNTTATNLTVLQSSGFIYLLPSLQKNQIKIEQLTLLNIYQFQDSFLSLNFPQNSKENKIILKDIYLKNQYSNIFMNFSKRNNILSFSSSGMQISKSNLIINNFSIIGYINEPVLTISNCQRVNINKIFIQDIFIFEKITNLLSFISSNLQVSEMSLSNIKTDYELNTMFNLDGTIDNILLDNLKIFNIDCQNCYQGLIKFNSLKFIKIENFMLYKNQCGQQACLFIQNTIFSLQQSKLISNKGLNQSTIYVQDSNLRIKMSTFKNNHVDGYAGAIYINDSNITVYQTYVINNTATKSGGLYFVKQKLQNRYIKQLFFRENIAPLGLENIWELPDMLALSLYGLVTKTSRNTVGNYTIDSPSYLINQNQQRINSSFIKVSSGQTLKELTLFNKTSMQYSKSQIQIQLFLYTQLGERIIDNSLSNCTAQQIYVESLKNYSLIELLNLQSNINITQISFDVITNSMQLGNLIYQLNPYHNKEDYILTSIQCDFMNNYDYYFTFSIKTLECQIGEYFNEGQCLKCDTEKGFYSVAINSTECLKMDPQIIKSITKSSIELQQGYWRLSYYQSKFEQCLYSENCLGGEFVSDDSCEVGHIGAICAECDLYNTRGESQFIQEFDKQCERKEVKVSYIIQLIIYTLCLFLIAYFISKQKLKMMVNFRTLKCQTVHYRILFNCQLEQQTFLIKQFLNFTQILYPILPLNYQLFNISNFMWPFGYQSKITQYFINYLSDQFTFEIIYLECIGSIILPVLQICVLGLVLSRFQRKISSKNIFLHLVKISFTFLFTYQLPYNIYILINNLSSRTYANIDWIQANLSYKYDTEIHLKWIFSFILPCLITYFILVPLFLFYNLRRHNNKTSHDPTKGTYGYFSLDYKQDFYYWEIIILFVKLLIIIINQFQNENYKISKKAIISILLFSYYILIAKYKPQIKKNSWDNDRKLIFIIFISLSTTAIHLVQDANSTQIICELILTFLIIIVIIQHLIAFILDFYKFNQKSFLLFQKKMKPYIIRLQIICPFLKIFLIQNQGNKQKVFQRFLIIKYKLKQLKLLNIKSFRSPKNLSFEEPSMLISQILRPGSGSRTFMLQQSPFIKSNRE